MQSAEQQGENVSAFTQLVLRFLYKTNYSRDAGVAAAHLTSRVLPKMQTSDDSLTKRYSTIASGRRDPEIVADRTSLYPNCNHLSMRDRVL